MDIKEFLMKEPKVKKMVLYKYLSLLPALDTAHLNLSLMESNNINIYLNLGDSEVIISFPNKKFTNDILVGYMKQKVYSLIEIPITELNKFISNTKFRNKWVSSKKYIDITNDEDIIKNIKNPTNKSNQS